MVILDNSFSLNFIRLLLQIKISRSLFNLYFIIFEVVIAIVPETASMLSLAQQMRTSHFVNQLAYNTSVALKTQVQNY